LVYIGGETDGYVLTWNAGLNSWEPQEPTGTSGGGTLAETLVLGNSTGGNNIVASAGDVLIGGGAIIASTPGNIVTPGALTLGITAGAGFDDGSLTLDGQGGYIQILAGDGAGVGVGGSVDISAGNSNGIDANGGDVYFYSGTGSGTGNGGNIQCFVMPSDGTGDRGEFQVYIGSDAPEDIAFRIDANKDGYFYNNLSINGKLTVDGLIDPTGLVLDEQATVPGGTPDAGKATIWVRSSDGYAVLTNSSGETTSLGGGSSLTAPTLLENGYVTIASNEDLTYIGGETDGYVLTWNASLETWEPQAPTGTAETPTLAEVLTESNSAGSQNIIDLLDPVNAHDAATKNYIDGYVETLGGDLSGSLPNPEVTDLTITNEEQGSVLYFDGANWVQLPPSADGYVLTTHGIGTNPTWEESSVTGELTGIQFITVFSGVETHDLDGWKTIGAVGITSTEATGTASLEAILYTSDGVSDGYARLYNTTTMEQIGSDLTTTDNLPTLLSSAITLTTGFNIYELQIKIEQDGTGEFVSCGMGRIKITGENGLTPPESSEDGYVAIGYNGDLTYLSGIEDGYVLTWDAGLSSWIAAEPTGGNSGENWISPELDADVNDWNPTGFSTATIVRVDAVGDGYSITGFDASATAVKKEIINVSSYDVVIANQDVGSVAINRIISQIGGLILAADDSMTIVYDPVTERWRVI
jgi:hypothetical protein